MTLAANSSAGQNNPLLALRGVGPALAARLTAEGFATLHDIAVFRPRAYRDWRTPQTVAEIGQSLILPQNDDTLSEVLVVGTVSQPRQYHGRVSMQRAMFDDDTGRCELLWFGRGGPRASVKDGSRILVNGRPKLVRSRGAVKLEIHVAVHRVLDAESTYEGRIWPVYPATRDLSSRTIATVIERNLDVLLEELGPDRLPQELRLRHDLPELHAAWREVHAPTSFEAIERARRRTLYDVFFGIALASLHRRLDQKRSGRALPMSRPPDLLPRFEAEIPFTLTAAQRRVIDEIWRDLGDTAPMNRLVQGDVGSGKTVVAAAAIVLAARAGAQSAFMAPTELLARQHARKLAPLLAPFGIGVEFIAASQPARARRASEDALAGGAIAVAVGTHALITERTIFAKLGLAIIDEQHRFGVVQRARLRAKGEAVHTLAMTATPIPRTLAQTRYADLDFSIIDELPPGRTPVKTFIRDDSARPRIYDFIRKEIRAGRQAYVVAPVIEEGESALRSALAEAEELQQRVFPDLRVALVHGRMPARERDGIMERFADHAIDILIATTVIEVGVDVPNAAVMIILEAHRFGLAQLHQLRGRVGRGRDAATCILVAPRKTARLDILTRTNDGFAIADADLELRGEGEFSGTLQSGSAQVLLRGQDEIELYLDAKSDAAAILECDPELMAPAHRPLRVLLDGNAASLAVQVTS